MSTRRTTSPEERIDLLLRNGQKFLSLDLLTDAIRFFRHALAQCAIEERDASASTRSEIAQRRAYASFLLQRLGASPRPA